MTGTISPPARSPLRLGSSMLRVEKVRALAWAPNGSFLAVGLSDTLVLWNGASEQGKLRRIPGLSCKTVSVSAGGEELAICSPQGGWRLLRTDSETLDGVRADGGPHVCDALWSPSGRSIALIGADRTIRLQDMATGAEKWTKTAPEDITASAWSPDASALAIGGAHGMVRILNTSNGAVRRALEVESGCERILSLTWSSDGGWVAAGCRDQTLRIWDTRSGKLIRLLEGHTGPTVGAAFCWNDRLLVSTAHDQTVRLWRCDIWEEIAVRGVRSPYPVMAVHPFELLVAVWDADASSVDVLEIDRETVLDVRGGPSLQYVNAKIVLVGESGVGKSGLAIRIAESRFQTTESTHGARFCHIQIPASAVTSLAPPVKAEVTLWDFAGQPEYHLIHQLFLDDADVALLVYACDRADDPFRGVEYWAKVLKKHLPPHARKILVAARADVNPVTAPDSRVSAFLAEFGLDRHFVTSAKTGMGSAELVHEIIGQIGWDRLTRVTTPRLFGVIREKLLERKKAGQVLVPVDEVQREVAALYPERADCNQEVISVIRSLQARGLVHGLNPANGQSQVLLHPELINQYGSSIIQAARAHPKSLGAVFERDVLHAELDDFAKVDRPGPVEERLILEATVELLVKHQLCFRHMGQLVFPSQFRSQRPPFEAIHPRSEVTYRFAGSVEAIYASLVVSLSYSGYFQLDECWSYAVEFTRNGYQLGFSMRQTGSGEGELDIYFYDGIDRYDRVSFIRFIMDHLRRNGIEVKENIRLYCKNPNCLQEVTNRAAIEKRIQDGETTITCQFCNTVIGIPRSVEQIFETVEQVRATVAEMQRKTEEGTKEAVKEVQSTIKTIGTAKDQGETIRILHLSDLHIRVGDTRLAGATLHSDLQMHFHIGRLDYLVISGDVADHALPEEYDNAAEFVDGLVNLFSLTPDRVIVVPGNHDVNWDKADEAFIRVPKRHLREAPKARVIDLGDKGVLICDESKYKERFTPFSQNFYRKIYSEPYDLDYEKQFRLWKADQDHILFLGLNTCWELDEHQPEKAGIHPAALAGALTELTEGQFENWLKIAVWHHPLGVGSLDDSFLSLLAQHGFQIALQGHRHKARHQFSVSDSIHIVEGGTFSAPEYEQTPGVAMQYSLLSYDPNRFRIRVEARRQQNPQGAWMSDPRYRLGDREVPYQAIKLRRRTKGAAGVN